MFKLHNSDITLNFMVLWLGSCGLSGSVVVFLLPAVKQCDPQPSFSVVSVVFVRFETRQKHVFQSASSHGGGDNLTDSWETSEGKAHQQTGL